MLNLSGRPKLFLYSLPTDMRKSFAGLGAVVEQSFPNALTSGAYFIFLNKRRTHMKVLYFDEDGLAIWYKRLEAGTFVRRQLDKTSLSRREFLML